MKLRRKLVCKFILFLSVIFSIFLIVNFSDYLKINDSFGVNYKVVVNENNLLKKELKDISGFELKSISHMAKVLYRDIYSFYDEIVINLGGLDVGDAVVNDVGLIGVVYKSSDDVSYVKLLTSDYNVSVIVNGVYGNLSNGVITLLDKYGDIKVGDYVYTSGYGDVEKDIFIGEVVEVSLDSDGLGKKAMVKLVDNYYLNYVGVIKRIK